jgi:hypothetical protein
LDERTASSRKIQRLSCEPVYIAAGYDVVNKNGFDAMMAPFDQNEHEQGEVGERVQVCS